MFPPFSQVPSLRLICRGIQSRKPIIHPHKLPALTVKEGLEIYYSLKRSNKTTSSEQRWKYLTDRFIFQDFGSMGAFMAAASAMLKAVSHFEDKVKLAKRRPAIKKK